jgi:hypothetical protein
LHGPIKEEYFKRLKNVKSWEDMLILLDEAVPYLTR